MMGSSIEGKRKELRGKKEWNKKKGRNEGKKEGRIQISVEE